MVGALVLGGGTRAGFVGDVVVQCLCVALLAASLWAWFGASKSDEEAAAKSDRWTSGLAALFGIVLIASVLASLVPVPPGVAATFGSSIGRGAEGSGDVQAQWRPLSVSPFLTWAALTSLIVPLVVFWAGSQLSAAWRSVVAAAVLAVGLISAVLGLAQVAQGPGSALRLFEFTNPTDAVGFFANRNHFAALLYCLIPLLMAWAIAGSRGWLQAGVLKNASSIPLAICGVYFVALIAALVVARSRAGILLAIGAIAGVVAMAAWHSRPRRGGSAGDQDERPLVRTILVLAGLAIVFALQFGVDRLLARLDTDLITDLRIPLARTTTETALKSLPLGTGLGTFVPVYSTVEKRHDVFIGFANRAHNDVVELLLEMGLPGLLVAGIFLAWYVPRAFAIWWAAEATSHSYLQKAATLVVLLLLLHSLVDYPLRTTALAALFALCCAFMTFAPVGEAPAAARPPRDGATRRSGSQRAPEEPRPAVQGGSWGDNVEWPKDWQKQ